MSIADDIREARSVAASVSVVRRIDTMMPGRTRELLLRLAEVVDEYRVRSTQLRDAFEAFIVAEVHANNGIPELPQEAVDLRAAIASLLRCIEVDEPVDRLQPVDATSADRPQAIVADEVNSYVSPEDAEAYAASRLKERE